MEAQLVIQEDRAYDSDYRWVNIEIQGVRVGKARVHESDGALTIDSLMIFDRYRRQGHARRLIRRLQREYRQIVADRVRPSARGFWEKMGFRPGEEGSYLWNVPIQIGMGGDDDSRYPFDCSSPVPQSSGRGGGDHLRRKQLGK